MKYSYFNFKKWDHRQILLTNDLGRWAFVSLPTFQTILDKGIIPSEKVLDFPVDCNTLTGSVNL